MASDRVFGPNARASSRRRGQVHQHGAATAAHRAVAMGTITMCLAVLCARGWSCSRFLALPRPEECRGMPERPAAQLDGADSAPLVSALSARIAEPDARSCLGGLARSFAVSSWYRGRACWRVARSGGPARRECMIMAGPQALTEQPVTRSAVYNRRCTKRHRRQHSA